MFKPVSVPDTRLTESAQAVYLAAAQFARKDIDSAYVKTHMTRTASRVDVDMSTVGIVDKLNPTWQRSSEKIANYLRQKFKRTDYVFHRNSATVKSIYNKFLELNKKEGRVFAQSDKWNPADIWAIAGKVNVQNIKTIDGLNRYLRSAMAKGLIIPISLKQSVGLKPVSAKAVNTDEQTTSIIQELPKFKAAQISTGGTNWTSSKMTKIDFVLEKGKSGHFELRQSKPGADVNGEMVIRTSAARHGKINGAHIRDAIRNNGGTIKIPNERELNQRSQVFDPVLIQQTYDLAKKLDPLSSLPIEQFRDMLEKKKDYSWLASKYVGMLYIEAIQKLTAPKRDQVVRDIYSHALVAGELAGPFLKVE